MQHYNIKQINSFDRQLCELLGQGFDRLPHALLAIGPEGLGKAIFGEGLAQLLLCESPNQFMACGTCQACHWLASGNHPDFRHVRPDSEEEDEDGAREKNKKRSPGLIRIDQIRELESFVFVGSHRMGRRVVLLTEAESMNAAAANALLKILEEPPASVYFILISSKPRFLLPTIRSRCRTLAFSAPESTAAAEMMAGTSLAKTDARFLDLAAGAPMRVIKWKESGLFAPLEGLIETLHSPPSDPAGLAARWDGLLKSEPAFSLEHLVEEIQRWLFDLALDRVAGRLHYHTGWSRTPPAGTQLDSKALLAAWHDLMSFRKSARHPLNQMLFLESLATHYLRALRPGRA